MTRVLWWAAWIFGIIAAISYLMLWRELFVTSLIAAMLSVLWYGFRVSPETGGGQ